MSAKKKEQDAPIRKLDLGKDFGAAVISINGVIVAFDKRGALSLPAKKTKDQTAKHLDLGPNFGAAEIYINGHTLSISARQSLAPQSNQAPANDAAPDPATKSAVTPQTKIGDVMPDGSIYAGTSFPGDQHIFLPSYIPSCMNLCDWDQAQERTAALSSNGHTDWRLPTVHQLADLYNRSAQLPNYLLTRDDFFWTDQQYPGGGALALRSFLGRPLSLSISKKHVARAIPVRTAPKPSP